MYKDLKMLLLLVNICDTYDTIRENNKSYLQLMMKQIITLEENNK